MTSGPPPPPPICNNGTNEATAAMANAVGEQGMASICLHGNHVSDASLGSHFLEDTMSSDFKALPKVLVALCKIERCPLPAHIHPSSSEVKTRRSGAPGASGGLEGVGTPAKVSALANNECDYWSEQSPSHRPGPGLKSQQGFRLSLCPFINKI